MHPEFGLKREQETRLICGEATNARSKFHFHSPLELYFVDEGEVEVWINDRHSILRAGELSVALSYDAHRYCSRKGSEAHVCYLIIPTALCGDFLAAVQNKRAGNPFIRDPATFQLMRDCCRRLRENPNKVTAQGLVYLILGCLLDRMELEEREEAVDPRLSARVLFYIHENLKGDLSLGAVAAALGYNPAYFSRYFKSCFRVGFNRYVTMVRLRQAVLLMRENRHSATYCAYESGFNSMRTFYRAFREEFQCTPKEYLARG